MNFLIIGDPLERLKPVTDSSLAMAREALSRMYEVHWATPADLCFWNGRVQVRTQKITDSSEGGLPRSERGYIEPQEINTFDGVWIRKDPPFDQNYLSLCWLLALEENNVPMVNKPSVLLRYHEKLLPWEALERGHLHAHEVIPSFMPMGPKFMVPQEFPRGESISKPWFGFGGKDVAKLPSAQSVAGQTLLQPYLPAVERTGDRRILYLDGQVIGSFARIPAPGKVTANIASGGTGLLKEMNPKEKALAERVGVFLKEIGITLAGADMIDEKISEINITSPTGFMSYRAIGGPRLEKIYLDYVETLI